jgi:hypothetical protein
MKKLAVAFLILFLSLSSCATDGEDKASNHSVSGFVTLVGTGNFPTLIITTDQNLSYELLGPLAQEIQEDHQYAKLAVEGKILQEPEGPLYGKLEVSSYTVLTMED